MGPDARHAYFVKCISALSGLTSEAVLLDPEPLATFLDDPSCLLLRARIMGGDNVVLSTKLGAEQGHESEVFITDLMKRKSVSGTS